ncbi:ankyrin repeat domain-containing protein, partial [Candidatus Dependentiae bacterium]
MVKKKLLCTILAISITCNTLASNSHNTSWYVHNFFRALKNSTSQILKSIKIKLFCFKKPTIWEKTKNGASTLARATTSKKGLLVTGAISLLATTIFALKKIFWPRGSNSNKDNPKPDSKTGPSTNKPDNKPPKPHPKDPEKSTSKEKIKPRKLGNIYKKITNTAKKIFDKHHFNKKLVEYCENDDLDGLKKMIKDGANINRKKFGTPKNKVTPIYAVYPLDIAIKNNAIQVARYLFSLNARRSTYIENLLIKSCKRGHLQMVKLLVEKGANVNLMVRKAPRDLRRHTALKFLVEKIYENRYVDTTNYKEIITYLVMHGANIYQRIQSPLELAEYYEDKSFYDLGIVETLLKAKFEKMCHDLDNRKTPLEFDSLSYHGKRCHSCNQTIDKNDTSFVVLAPCGHIMHKDCLKNRFNSGEYTCPHCQSKIEDIEYLHKAKLRWLQDSNIQNLLHYAIRS